MVNEMISPFQAALEYCLNKKGHGAQSLLARKTGISQQAISSLLTKRNYGKAQTMQVIANALGYELVDFLEFGNSLVSGQPTESFKKLELSVNPAVIKLIPLLDNLDDKGLELVTEFVKYINSKS